MSFQLYYRKNLAETENKILKIHFHSHSQLVGKEGEYGILEEIQPGEGHSSPELIVGSWKGLPVVVEKCLDAPEESLRSIRDFLDHPEPGITQLIIRASELLTWRENHRYCGKCGEKTEMLDLEPALKCTPCGLSVYPTLSPAVMVRIERGDKILLARNSTFSSPIFSLIAGFVEAGETLEDAVHREVMEEVGLEVENLRYFHSQSWPMPHTLLAGFIADYKSGVIRPDGSEIVEAQWGDPEDALAKPRKGSLAFEMIHDFIEVRNARKS